MIRRLVLRLSLAAALVLGVPLFAQLQQLGGIGGQIHIVGADFPPRQILVELRLHDSTIGSAYTDAEGRFSFSSLVGNPYHIVVNDETYYPVDQLVNLRPEAPNAIIDITLRPREPQKKDDPLGARASGANPFLVDPAEYNKNFPKKAVKEYQRGLDAEHKGKRDEAIAYYLDALKIAPDYYPAHNNLGALYLGKADFKPAETQFEEAIRLDQNDAQAYFNLGNVLLMTHRYAESETALSSGLQRRPDSAFGHFLQGCLYERTARYEQADVSLHRALELDPTMWQAQLQIANLYVQQNRREDAITELETFLKSFPSSPAAPKAKEVLQKLQGKPQPADGSPK